MFAYIIAFSAKLCYFRIMNTNSNKTCSMSYALTSKPTPEHFVNHLHNEYELLFFFQGKTEIVVDSKTYKMKRGDLFIIKPAVYHSVKVLDKDFAYERFVLNFSTSFVPKTAKEFLENCLDLYNFPENSLIYNMIAEWGNLKEQKYLTESDEDALVFAKTLLLLLSSQKNQKTILPIKTNKTIEEIVKYIDEHPADKITAETLAKIFFVSTSSIIHSFKQHFNISLMNYVNKKRMLYAQRLITGGFSPAEASEKLNFSDYSTFYRQYKKFLGVSPKNVRK